MNTLITLEDLTLHNHEPCIQDLRLAEALGFSQVRDIRKIIQRNLPELESHGEVCATVAQTSAKGGRPGIEYLLNEAQALIICMFSRTDEAAMVRKLLIQVFISWRKGEFGANPDQAATSDLLQTAPLAARMDAVRIGIRLHGLAYGRSLWAEVGMPPPPTIPLVEDQNAAQCLALILAHQLASDTIANHIDNASQGDVDAIEQLAAFGIVLFNGGIAIANRGQKLSDLFKGSLWDNNKWPHALRNLQGSAPAGRVTFGEGQHRATYIPLKHLE